MSNVVLCPGQGAQSVGMARAWFDHPEEAVRGVVRETFQAAERVVGGRLGSPLTALCFDGPAERLNRTDIAQPAIYVASVACWRALSRLGGPASGGVDGGGVGLTAAAGLSLGEYTALHLAGVFGFEDGLELVLLRGSAMQDAAGATPSGMVALIGADESQARAVCERAAGSGVLVCANFNAPGQVVLSGDAAACERAVSAAGDLGLRAQALAVAGAFHSPIMRPAAERLAQALDGVPMRPPTCVVMSNVTARPHAGPEAPGQDTDGQGVLAGIRARLVEQLTAPVRWAEGCAWMIAQSPRWNASGAGVRWHELAPGRTLGGLMRRIDKSVKVEQHDEPAAK